MYGGRRRIQIRAGLGLSTVSPCICLQLPAEVILFMPDPCSCCRWNHKGMSAFVRSFLRNRARIASVFLHVVWVAPCSAPGFGSLGTWILSCRRSRTTLRGDPWGHIGHPIPKWKAIDGCGCVHQRCKLGWLGGVNSYDTFISNFFTCSREPEPHHKKSRASHASP